MKVKIIDGNKVYLKSSWLLTKILFSVCQAFNLFTIVFAIVKFGTAKIGGFELFHDVGLSLLAAVLMFVPFAVRKLAGWYFPNLIIISVYFIVMSNLQGGEIWHLYNQVAFYDKFMHTLNGVIFTYFGFSLIGMLNRLPEKNRDISPLFCVLFAFGFAMLVEYIWEIYEYILDSCSEIFNMQRWKDNLIGMTEDGNYIVSSRRGSAITDTLMDMIVHAIGALPICVWGYIKMRRESADWIVRTAVLSRRQVNYVTKNNGVLDEETEKSKIILKKN